VKAPWMPKADISCRVSEVIAGCEGLTGAPVRPPVPVEDIIERYLGLTLSFQDLERTLGAGPVRCSGRPTSEERSSASTRS
jgi:hypothetical protein